MPNRAIFLDRDGTLILEVGHLHRAEDISLYPGAVEAVTMTNQRGILAVVITNQSAVARGFLSEDELHEVHQVLAERFLEQGARLDAFYYCPHHPEGNGVYRQVCQCRKPQPGLLLQAAEELDIDLSGSHVIGDRLADVEVGARAGCASSVLVKTGYGALELALLTDGTCRPHYIAEDVLDGVNWILAQEQDLRFGSDS